MNGTRYRVVINRGKKANIFLRRWYLDRFDDIEVRTTYQNAVWNEWLRRLMQTLRGAGRSLVEGEWNSGEHN